MAQEATKHIALIAFDDEDGTLYVGTFDTEEEAQTQAENAAIEANEIIGDASAPLGTGYGTTTVASDWKAELQERIDKLTTSRIRNGGAKPAYQEDF